jgi:hypothetical protein
MIRIASLLPLLVACGVRAAPLNYSVSWLGNSFCGASNKWVQNFFIHTRVEPDGTVHTWSHWDEGGKKFGVHKDVENTGWIDILTGISAHRRANGEYLVFVEEDYKAKVLLYRWKP